MTISPITITAELLDDLQRKAKAAEQSGHWYSARDIGCLIREVTDEQYVIAANPAVVDAMAEHIRSLNERLERAEKDAGRYRWLRENASVILCREVGFTAESGRRIYSTMPSQREVGAAIDAAIAQEGQSHE